MWEARTQPIPSGFRYQILEGGVTLTFRELFDHLESDAVFAEWYSDTLSRAPLQAFFWEHPPLTAGNVDRVGEFVLIESASLTRLHADSRPFEDQFERHPGSEVVTFPNLGGDALLIVPTPAAPHEVYPHLAAFLRAAPGQQIQVLWRAVARAVRETLTSEPRWLSTAGLGVPWLHLRLDTVPKYYRYAPYKRGPGPTR